MTVVSPSRSVILDDLVMAGLDPAIHVLASEHRPKKDVDVRHADKFTQSALTAMAGHDGARKL
jgi:hypothetical protein